MAASFCLKHFLRSNNDIVRRSIHRWVAPTLRELYRRQKRAGPQPVTPRSTFLEWNYKAELYAFGQRLNEKFTEENLRTAFTHQSYIDQEEQKRIKMGIAKEEAQLAISNNVEFAEKGDAVMSNYILRYLRHCLPYFPEEGIVATHDHLMSNEVLSHVGFNLGMRDLLFCAEFPPNETTLAQSLKALVGALIHDDSTERAELFVQDFVLTQLVGKDIHELWNVFNPMGVLTKILEREGRVLPEARLIRESGRNTILSIFVVGVYSNKQFLGIGPGETLDVAEEMAARDSLRRMFRLTIDQLPLPLGKEGRLLQLSSDAPNLSINEWTSQNALKRLQSREDNKQLKEAVSQS